jgi:hypothetical protein
MPLREIRARMAKPPSDRRLREELLYLKRLGLARSEGYGRGSKWVLERSRLKVLMPRHPMSTSSGPKQGCAWLWRDNTMFGSGGRGAVYWFKREADE